MAKTMLLLFLTLGLMIQGCYKAKYKAEDAPTFVADFESRLGKQSIAYNLESWKYLSTGKSDSLNYYRSKLVDLFNEQNLLEKAEAYRKIVKDDILKRKLDLIYRRILYSKINYCPDIKNLIDLLNDKLSKIRTILPEGKTPNFAYFLCDFYEEELNRKERKLLREIGDGLAQLIRLRNLAAKQMGYNSYYTMNAFTEHLDVHFLDSTFAQLEELSHDCFNSILDISSNIPQDSAKALCDLIRQHADLLEEYNYYFYRNTDDWHKILTKTFEGLGFNLNKLPIYFNDADSTINTTTKTFAINCSNDIRVVSSLSGGIDAFNSFLRAVSFAIYLSHINQDSFLFRGNPSGMRTEIISTIFKDIISTEKWRNEYLNLPDDFTFRWQQGIDKFRLIELRSNLLLLEFEKQLYLNQALKAGEMFRELSEKVMTVSGVDSSAWWLVLDDFINRPFYNQKKLVAELVAAQILDCLTEDESIIESSLLKYTLVQYCFSNGQRYDWNDILIQTTGEGLKVKYYFKRLNIPIDSDY